MAGKYSDIDLLIVLSDMDSAFSEIEKLNEIKFQIGLDNELFISTNPVTEDLLEKTDLPLIKNVLREGIII
jgi:predicted nucleotidyltransferase